jgi:hypothetical protein
MCLSTRSLAMDLYVTILSRIYVWLYTGFGLVNGFTYHLSTRFIITSNYSAAPNLHNSQTIIVPAAANLHNSQTTIVPAAANLHNSQTTIVPAAANLHNLQTTIVPAKSFKPQKTNTYAELNKYSSR